MRCKQVLSCLAKAVDLSLKSIVVIYRMSKREGHDAVVLMDSFLPCKVYKFCATPSNRCFPRAIKEQVVELQQGFDLRDAGPAVSPRFKALTHFLMGF